MALPFWWDRAICVSPFVYRVAKIIPGSAKLHICPLGIKVDSANTRTYKVGNTREPLVNCMGWPVVKEQKRADLIPKIAHELEIKKVSYSWTVLGDGKNSVSVYKND